MTLLFRCLVILNLYLACPTPLLGQILRFHHLSVENGLPHNTIEDIAQDKLGFIWIATQEGLCKFDGLHVQVYSASDASNSPLNNRPSRLYIDSKGALWVSFSSTKSICRYNYGTDDFDRITQEQVPVHLSAAVTMGGHQMQQISIHGYTWMIRDQKLQQISQRTGSSERIELGNSKGRFLFADHTGVLWLGTENAGVYYADSQINYFKHYFSSALKKQSIRSILEDKEGHLWVGTQDAGVFIKRKHRTDFDAFPLTGRSIFEKEGTLQIRQLFQDRKGNVWIGTRAGLYRYDPTTHLLIHYNISQRKIPHNWVYAINEDARGILWIGTWHGVAYYDIEADLFRQLPVETTLPHAAVRAIAPDGQNGVWVGTEGGLARITYTVRQGKPYAWKSYFHLHNANDHHTLPDNFIYAFDIDNSGQLWLGTRKGLARMDKDERFSNFRRDARLGNDIIRGVICRDQEVWVSHSFGLSRMKSDGKTVRHFTTSDGLPFNEFSENASYSMNKSEVLYFGGTQGLIEINPDSLSTNKPPPKLVFTDLLVDGNAVAFEHTADTLMFPHHIKGFSLRFTALDFADPQKNMYCYRLLGMDSLWSFVDAKQAMASYSALSPGDYILEVKASNNEGVWTTDPLVMTIRVLPVWWRTTVAYIVYLILLFLVVCSMIIWFKYARRLPLKRYVTPSRGTQADSPINLTQKDLKPRNLIDETFLQNAISLVEQHLSDVNFSPDVFAEKMAVSRAQLFRKIKSATDQTVIEFVTTIRLQKAAELLKKSSLSIKEIAADTGFSEASNFSRSFSKLYGISPSDFVKTNTDNRGKR